MLKQISSTRSWIKFHFYVHVCFCDIWCRVQLGNNDLCRQRRERVLVSPPPHGNFCWLRLITNCPIFGHNFPPSEALTNLLTLWSCLLYFLLYHSHWFFPHEEGSKTSLARFQFFSINPPFPCSKSLARACRREFIAALGELFNSICSMKLQRSACFTLHFQKLPFTNHGFLCSHLVHSDSWVVLCKTIYFLRDGIGEQVPRNMFPVSRCDALSSRPANRWIRAEDLW